MYYLNQVIYTFISRRSVFSWRYE